MSFNELVRLLETNGFALVRQKGSVRYYAKSGWPKLIRVDYHGAKQVRTGTCHSILERLVSRTREGIPMIDLPYSLVIEATDEPDYFSFFSEELEGFTGSGRSLEECLAQAKFGMEEHVGLLAERGMPVPPVNRDPVVIIRNEQREAA